MRRGSGRGRANGGAARCRVARSLAVLPVPSVHRTVLMRIRQPFGSPRATYPQLRFHPQAGVVACGRGCFGRGVWVASLICSMDRSRRLATWPRWMTRRSSMLPRGWSRTENAACARKTPVMAELFARRTGLPPGERADWWVDPQAAVGAELGASQNISTWMALAQAHRGVVLMDRLPRIASLFEAGVISEMLVRAIEYRSALVTDEQAIARVDAL